MTACIPFLKPFLLSLESGFLRADKIDVQRTGPSTHSSGSKPSGWSSKPGYIEIPDHRRDNAREHAIELQVPTRHWAWFDAMFQQFYDQLQIYYELENGICGYRYWCCRSECLCLLFSLSSLALFPSFCFSRGCSRLFVWNTCQRMIQVLFLAFCLKKQCQSHSNKALPTPGFWLKIIHLKGYKISIRERLP